MYDYLIIDSVLLGYQILNASEPDRDLKEITLVSGRKVYKGFLRKFIEVINFLDKKYLSEQGELVFLYDNYESREELRQLFKPLSESDSRKSINTSYKQNRRSEKTEFYASLDIIRHYMLVTKPRYHTARIPNLEADDLVKPCIDFLKKRKPDCKVLLVTNDSDWCKYLSDNVQYLPETYKEPFGSARFIDRYGFQPTEDSIILYKLLYGDDADNVEPVFPEFSPKLKKYIINTFSSVIDFLYESKANTELSPHILLIKSKEFDIKSAYKMLAAIPVSENHFKHIFTTGRNSEVNLKVINDIIFEVRTDSSTGFVFGDIKVPRYSPKE